jgi:hypothetical protein
MPGYNTLDFYCDRDGCNNSAGLSEKYCEECKVIDWGIDPKRDAYIALEERCETLWRKFMNESESKLRSEYLHARQERWFEFLEARGEDPNEVDADRSMNVRGGI